MTVAIIGLIALRAVNGLDAGKSTAPDINAEPASSKPRLPTGADDRPGRPAGRLIRMPALALYVEAVKKGRE
jgi:hypothetical protein